MKINENISDEMLEELLNGLDDNIEVPDDVHKSWKDAIRKESRSIKILSVSRRITQVAAVLLLFVGATVLFRNGGVIGNTSVPDAGGIKYAITSQPAEAMLLDMVESDSETEAGMSRKSSGEAVAAVVEDSENGIVFAMYDAETPAENGYSGALITNAACTFSTGDPDSAAEYVQSALTGIDGYIESLELTDSKYSAVARVRNDQLSVFIENLEGLTKNFKVSIETRPVDEVYYNADTRLEAAYQTAQLLEAQLNASDAKETSGLYESLTAVYDEIDTIERAASAARNDIQYATVSINADITSLRNAFRSFYYGFGRDMAVTAVIILPFAAIIAACFTVIKKKKH